MEHDDRLALGLAAFIGGAGVMHFVTPSFFDAIVPRWMPGRPRMTTYLSGVAELLGAVLVADPRTRRIGGWWCLAVFLGVYPANVQMALDGGVADAPSSTMNSAVAAWVRLPFQIPMIWAAWRVARGSRRPSVA
jgi:uncharacterized membrane protein